MKTYTILRQFFLNASGNVNYEKLRLLRAAAASSGIQYMGVEDDPSGEASYIFRAERKQMLKAVNALIAFGVLDDDLLDDFDGAFEASWI